MGRASLIIDKDRLKEEIYKAEAAQTFENQSRLFEFICQTDWAKSIKDSLGRPKEVSPANIYQRVMEFKIELKTGKGKKGGGIKSGIRKPRRRGTNELSLLQSTPEPYKGLAAKVTAGSMRAAIRLKCLECCCHQPKEVRACQITSCPLWQFLKRDK
jgi:hypothetical protein